MPRITLLLAFAALTSPCVRAAQSLLPVWSSQTGGGSGSGDITLPFESVRDVLALRDGGYVVAINEFDGQQSLRHLLRKISANGTAVWEAESTPPNPSLAQVRARGFSQLVELAGGDILGLRFNSPASLPRLERFSSNGVFQGCAPGSFLLEAMPDGGYFTLHYWTILQSIARRYDANGQLVWQRELDGLARHIQVDPLGNIYLFGANEEVTSTSIPMMASRISVDGVVASTTCVLIPPCNHVGPAWFQSESTWNASGSRSADMHLDLRGHVHMATSVAAGFWRLHPFDRVGGLTWSYELVDISSGELPWFVRSDALGNAWVVGAEIQGGVTGQIFVRRFASDGTVLGTTYPPFASGRPVDAYVDDDGSFIAGIYDDATSPPTMSVIGFRMDGTAIGPVVTRPTIEGGSSIPGSEGFVRGADGTALLAQTAPAPAGGALGLSASLTAVNIGEQVGTITCAQSVPNSSGATGSLAALGSTSVARARMTLLARDLPAGVTGLFLTASGSGLIANAGGSQGNLCLISGIGRYVRFDEVRGSDSNGQLALGLRIGETPTPTGFASAMAGETRDFQLWHRDANPTVTSNFTDAVSVIFTP